VPQPRATWVAFAKKGKKVAKGDDKKICKCWKQKIFTIYQMNKERFGMSVQIQKRVPQCNMVGPVRAQFAWRTGGGPMGGFLYQVDEMEGNLRMGKLIVDEMEG
jgi:hypothetical protein